MSASQSWLDNPKGLDTNVAVLKSGLAIGSAQSPLGAVFAESFEANNLAVESTITPPLTVGNQTINTAAGTVNFAAAATALTVTNSLVTANSVVLAVVRTNDATALLKNVVPTAGAFTINLNAAATAETSVGFVVIN